MSLNSAIMKLHHMLLRIAGLPLFALGSALALTVIATLLAASAANTRLAAAVAIAIDQDVARLETRMNAYLALLRATRSFVTAEGAALDRASFSRFVAGLNIPADYPGIQGIGYSPRVDTRNIPAFEAAIRRSGGTEDFKFFPHGTRELAFSVVYLEPLDERNRAAIGFDMYSEPVRAEAMDRARDSGGYAMSGSVVLKQEIGPDKSPGFLIYTPLYRGAGEPATVAQRRERLVAFVYAPFRASDFFSGLFRGDGVVALQAIYASRSPEPRTLLFGEHAGASTEIETRQIEFGGQVWAVQFAERTGPRSTALMPYAVAIVGLVMSVLLFLLARAQTAARQRAEAQKELSQQQAQFAEMFLGIVSHDLRNPLNVITLNTSLLDRTALPQEARRPVERIRSSSNLALRLIRDLLDFTQSRLGSGMRVARTPGDLREIVQQALDEVSTMYPGRHFVVETEGDGAGSWDADRITQLVSNLLMNALVHGSAESPITVRIVGRDTFVELSVHNQGEPIAPELIPVVFEPLRQGQAKAGAAARNIGLGLYIVRQIVLAHQGSIRCESSRAGGTRFIADLPRSASGS